MFKTFAKTALGLVAAAFISAAAADANAQGFGIPAANPVVIDSGRHLTGVEYDPWNDQTVVRTHRDLVRDSAFDPARGYVDPGSLQFVNRYFYDNYGALFLEKGWKWTSYGVPHGDVTKTRVTNYVPGIQHHDSSRVVYSTQHPQQHNHKHNNHPHHGGGVQQQDSTRVQYFQIPGGNGGRPNVQREDSTRVLFSKQNGQGQGRGQQQRGR